jgi:hypothetical protein
LLILKDLLRRQMILARKEPANQLAAVE